ncbi:O-antigen/teichoic acid export membrane protein [Bradyrhizobium sp. S3.3.6]
MATFSHQGSTFVSNFLVIKLLDHVTYGKFSLVTLTAFYAANVLQFAIGLTASKFVARYVADDDRLRSAIWVCGVFTFASGLVGFAILALSSAILARSVFIEPSLTWPLTVVSLSVPGLIGMVFLGGLLQGLHEFRALAISSMLSGLLFVVIMAAGAWMDGLIGAIWGFVAGSTIRCMIMGGATMLALRSVVIGRSVSWRKVRSEMSEEILRFQIPAGLAGFITLPTLWLIPTILTRSTQNFSDVALYSVIFMLKSLVVIPASVISLALQPSAEKACALDQFEEATRIFRASSLAAFAFATVAALFVAICAQKVLTVLGQSFAVAAFELQLMMIAAVAEATAVSLYMRIQATGRMWGSIFATLLPRDLTMLFIVTAFAASYGLRAAIVAHVAGATVNLIGVYWLSVKAVGRLGLSSGTVQSSRLS